MTEGSLEWAVPAREPEVIDALILAATGLLGAEAEVLPPAENDLAPVALTLLTPTAAVARVVPVRGVEEVDPAVLVLCLATSTLFALAAVGAVTR